MHLAGFRSEENETGGKNTQSCCGLWCVFSSSRKTSESSLEMKAIKYIYIIKTGVSLVWFLLKTILMLIPPTGGAIDQDVLFLTKMHFKLNINRTAVIKLWLMDLDLGVRVKPATTRRTTL